MLEGIISMLFGAYCMACLIRFIDFGFTKETGPLGLYYKWLLDFGRVHYRRNEEGEEEIINARWYYWPLGGCVHCFGFWLSLPLAVCLAVIYANHPGMFAFILLAFQGLVFRFTEIQER